MVKVATSEALPGHFYTVHRLLRYSPHTICHHGSNTYTSCCLSQIQLKVRSSNLIIQNGHWNILACLTLLGNSHLKRSEISYSGELKLYSADSDALSTASPQEHSRSVPSNQNRVHQLASSGTMCRTKGWKSAKCGHKWFTLTAPCAEGKNFSNCMSFELQQARQPKKIHIAPAGECPKCDKKDDYDGDTVRLVKSTKRGTKFGTGPSRRDAGLECHCACTVM